MLYLRRLQLCALENRGAGRQRSIVCGHLEDFLVELPDLVLERTDSARVLLVELREARRRQCLILLAIGEE